MENPLNTQCFRAPVDRNGAKCEVGDGKFYHALSLHFTLLNALSLTFIIHSFLFSTSTFLNCFRWKGRGILCGANIVIMLSLIIVWPCSDELMDILADIRLFEYFFMMSHGSHSGNQITETILLFFLAIASISATSISEKLCFTLETHLCFVVNLAVARIRLSRTELPQE